MNSLKFAFAYCLASLISASACDLCAVYRAGDARGDTSEGPVISVAEQFIPYRTSQFDGKEVTLPNPEYVDSSTTHIVPGYNFSPRFGISLNVPLVVKKFQRTDIRYAIGAPPVIFTEKGHESGLGDIALILRGTILTKSEMEYGWRLNVLAGVKFPTGNTDRIDDEVEQSIIFNTFLPPGTPHDPLGHSITGVHQHMLSQGSGSFDGIFGVTASGNWQHWFCSIQLQYYLRTKGASDFEFGDEFMASGGPGVFLLLKKNYTLSLQANAVYDYMARDELLGQESDRTGSTGWYLGPLVTFTWKSHFSANAGIDLPLDIDNNFIQSVPNYRLHGGVSWSF